MQQARRYNTEGYSQVCRDLPEGYECTCGAGHRRVGGACAAVCSQGCVRGVCVQPDRCRCDFGYVGANCTIQCQCNGHSHCEGPDKLDVCTECHNNTMVTQHTRQLIESHVIAPGKKLGTTT